MYRCFYNVLKLCLFYLIKLYKTSVELSRKKIPIVRPKITSLCVIELNAIYIKTECFCFRSQQLSADAWTHGPFWMSTDQKKTKHSSPPSFFCSQSRFFTFVLHSSVQTHLRSHRGRSELAGCLKAGSLGAAAALQRATSVITGCLGLQGRAGWNVCTCVCLSYLAFHTFSVCFSVSCGRISHLKYSGGCRNALINAVTLQSPVLCIYEAEASRFGQMTDLLTSCWCMWGPGNSGKSLIF